MKILIFRNSNFGDYFISIPALRLLRKKYTNSKISYLTIQNRKNFMLPSKIGNEKIVDNFILIKKNKYKSFKDLKRIIFQLKKKKFNKFIYLQEYNDFFSIMKHYIFFRLVFIPEYIGFKNYFNRKSYLKESETIQITKRIFKNINIKKISNFSFLESYNEKKIIQNKYFTIAPGGFALGRLPNQIKNNKPVRWKSDKWIKLCERLILKYKNTKIVVTGTKKEEKLAKKLKSKFTKNVINKCGNTNVNEWINIIKHSDLHICQDNGSMHLATLFKKKNISLFNNHDVFGKWFPLNSNAYIIRLKGDINTIGINHVFAGVKKLLKK